MKRVAEGGADDDDGRDSAVGGDSVEAGPSVFTAVDLSAAYLQVPMSPESVEYWAPVKHVTTCGTPTVSALRSMQDDNFAWPTTEVIRTQQRLDHADAPCAAHEGGLVRVGGKLWIPR